MKKFFASRRARLVAAVFVLVTSTGLFLRPGADPVTFDPYTAVLTAAAEHKVTEASLDDVERTVTVTLTDGSELTAHFPAGGGDTLATTLADSGAKVEVVPVKKPSLLAAIVAFLAPLLVLGLVLVLVMRFYTKGLGKLGKGKDRAVDVPTVTFADVAGVDEAVEELRDLVTFLADPAAYLAAGATAPKGVLLDGPPGTGKTLLARAVAGEAGIPFFSVSGSDFVEVYAGVGPARVRQLFDKARATERAIIFIDEIDAIGRKRSSGNISPGERELENTLNQLLVEMDGFVDSGVILLAATNRPDLLDDALVRPGRFDRRVTVNLPDRRGREAILAVHARTRRLADDVDLAALAGRTPGMSGAELANVLNAAALIAARAGEPAIVNAHLDEALATVVMGRARRNASVTDRDRRITAWHEAGHALVALLTTEHPDPVSVTIVPRGHAGGVTWMGGTEENFTTRDEALARIRVALGGRAGEELLLDGAFTQGAGSDLAQATRIAVGMVCAWGMGSTLAVRNPDDALDNDAVAAEVNALLTAELDAARALLGSHRALLATVAELLLDVETLSGAELAQVAATHRAG